MSHDGLGLERDAGGLPYATGYLHLRSAAVHRGERVVRGQKLGEVGLFPASDLIPHVHWRLYGAHGTLDPMSKTIGCFDRAKHYSATALELTFPLAC